MTALKISPLAIPLANHRTAVHEYCALAARLPADVWLWPVAPGKWSPAQITQHVTLAIETFTDEFAGRAGMALKLTVWRRFVLRTFLLPRLLSSGRFPASIKAPREIRPSTTPATQADALERLKQASSALDAIATAAPSSRSRRLTHPYFGRVPALTAVRLLELHTRHHLSQLPHRAGA